MLLPLHGYELMTLSTLFSFLSVGVACSTLLCLPVLAATYEDRAAMLARSGHRDDAIRVMSEAIKLSPKTSSLYSARARYYIDGEHYDLGLADLKKAVALDTNTNKAWLYRMMADCDANLEKYEDAIVDLKKAIAIKPHEEYYKMLGEIYYQLRRLDDAVDSYSKGIAVNNKAVWLYRGRGDIYFQQHKYQKAVEDYSSVIRLAPKEPMGYGCRAKAYERLGRKDLADKDYAKSNKDADFMRDVLK